MSGSVWHFVLSFPLGKMDPLQTWYVKYLNQNGLMSLLNKEVTTKAFLTLPDILCISF